MSEFEDDDELGIEAAIGEAPANKERKKGKKGPPTRTREPMTVIAAPQVAIPRPVPDETPAPPTHPKHETSKEAVNRWPLVLAYTREQGLRPGDLMIRVTRIGIGAHATNPVLMNQSIDGAVVAGNESVSAADSLVEYITNVCHLGRRGAAKYSLEFLYKVAPPGSKGGNLICYGDLTLDDPEEIVAMRRREQEFMRNMNPAPASSSPYVLPARPWQAPPTSVATSGFIAPAAGDNPQVEAMRRELAELLGRFGAIMETRPQGVAAPPPQPIVQERRLTPQEEQYIEEGKFREMAARLGFVQKDSIVPAAEPVAKQEPAVVVRQTVTDPVNGMEAFLESMEKFHKLGPRVGKIFGFNSGESEGEAEAPAAPIQIVPSEEDKNPYGLQEVPVARFQGAPIMMPTKTDGWMEWAQAFVGANPTVAMEFLSKALNNQAFQTLIGRLSAIGGQPAAAAQAAQSQGLIGTGTANGLAATAPRFSGPTA